MTPKFRLHDDAIRDDRRKSKGETLHRKQVRTIKYDTMPAIDREAAA